VDLVQWGIILAFRAEAPHRKHKKRLIVSVWDGAYKIRM